MQSLSQMPDMRGDAGRIRVVITGVSPEIESGRFPIKRTIGEKVTVEADIFADSHDALSARLLYRPEGASTWMEAPMQPLVNDRWRGEFAVPSLGRFRYTLIAWIDPFTTWHRDLMKKNEARQDVTVDLLTGVGLIKEAAGRASGEDARRLTAWGAALRTTSDPENSLRQATEEGLADLMERYADRRFATTYDKELCVAVDREKARFSAWYEMFPRSCWTASERHGTFKDCERRLARIAAMGFDVLYLPPVHPIGHSHRKGRNNATSASPDDPGSPWAIGSPQGGHKALHPEFGTLEDFRGLVSAAKNHGIEIALDLAFQCSPDHPYVKEHPEWFRWRPDGTVQYAENPPKKYEDIYPFQFETDQWHNLWEELQSIVFFWIEQGVRIFRVDNPHTKPFPFWEWLIGNVTRQYPDVIFLAEAFTRPKVMYRLAQLGFTQSYTYFAWRNTKWELTSYFTELTQTEVAEYFRTNLWPNTPDILTEYLQTGGRAAFMTRLTLAATLGASFGIYGPAYELCEDRPREPGSEEYLNSEKYEIRRWEIDREDTLAPFISRLNEIRRENAALKRDGSLRFHEVDNEQLLCYSKKSDDGTNVVLIMVNLDPHHTQRGWTALQLEALGLDAGRSFQVHDLLSDARYLWHGPRNFVELDPHISPVHIFRVRRRLRTEHQFDYYM